MQDESTPEARARQPLRRLHLLYHEVTLRRSEYSYSIERQQFERHVDLFVQMRKAERFDLWPEITFDDGHISNFELRLPVLQSRGLIARFFITAGWTGNRPGYMGWPELRSLHASGQLIGAHGWSHTLLTHCSKKELDKELSGARLLLEDKLGASVTTMSLPGGRYNQRVLAACREAGYSRIYTSEPSAERGPQQIHGRTAEYPPGHDLGVDSDVYFNLAAACCRAWSANTERRPPRRDCWEIDCMKNSGRY